MIDKERLAKKAATYGIALEEKQLESFASYAALLLEWNKKMNLTAITLPEAVEDKHFVDSLLLAHQPEVAGKLVDVGSGAGFPGVVAKIYKPALKVSLMEPTGKRGLFQQEVAYTLGLELDLVRERAEEAARKGWRESFDVATARAVAALPALCEFCLPLVKVGGWFIAMKGEASEELAAAAMAIQKLGGTFKEQRNFTLPDGSVRMLVMIQKTSPTPPVYPRNGGKIIKKPL